TITSFFMGVSVRCYTLSAPVLPANCFRRVRKTRSVPPQPTLRPRALSHGAASSGWIAGRWRRHVSRGRWSQYLGEDRLQCVRPDLVSLQRGMKAVDCHSITEPAVLVRKLVVHVYESDLPAVGEPCEKRVDPFNLRHHD